MFVWSLMMVWSIGPVLEPVNIGCAAGQPLALVGSDDVR
jgi:hypothetical protein